MIYVKKTGITVLAVGIVILSILSIMGLVYLTKMSFSSQDDNCGGTTKTEKNIARMTVVLLWIQIAMVLVGSIIQTVWIESA